MDCANLNCPEMFIYTEGIGLIVHMTHLNILAAKGFNT